MTEPLNRNEQGTKAMKILVIDDDRVTRLTLKKVLNKAGFEVFDAADGSEGFSRFIELNPDLVLMDVMMPKMDGYSAIQAIRNYEKKRAVPIIMLTALDDLESIDYAFNVGATDFITKPINWSLLTQRVKYAAKASETEGKLLTSQAQLKFSQRLSKLGYWEWDINTDTVTGSGSVFDLFAVPNREDMSMEQFSANILTKDSMYFQKVIADSLQGMVKDIHVSFRIHKPDNTISHVDCLGEVVFDKLQNPIKIMGSVQDISRLHKAESLIDYQANHDHLTELPNRVFFNKTLDEHLADGPKDKLTNSLSAVVVIDIDRFKKVNDNLGQKDGDSLLFSVAKRLERVTREEDFVARLGSDEFAILLKNVQDERELNQSIIRIFNELGKEHYFDKQDLFVSFSIGISVVGQDGNNVSDLIAHANIARNEAKQQGGDQFLFYRKKMNAESKKELILEYDLRKALERNEIEVYYQPQVYGDSLKPYGAEALLRWNHSTEGLISPTVFIPMAESTELIIDIGLFVLESAVKEAEKWHKLGYDNMHIGINISGRQFANSDLIKNVQQVLANSSLAAKFLDLEITESLAMSNANHNISVLKGLKALGVDISIDDFGTGYSSLAYLHSFPIDALKIDRSFIMNLGSQEGKAIVETIIAMAESLKLQVIAEGIENLEQEQELQKRKCDIFQGYKFGKPMKADDFEKYLKDNY